MGGILSNEEDEDSFKNAEANSEIVSASQILIVIQIALAVLFGVCSMITDVNDSSPGTALQGYEMFIGVEIMMFIGFGYLMTFLRKYGIGAVAFTMIVTAIGLQWALFTESFFVQWWNTDEDTKSWDYVEINIYSLLQALYAISSVLISFGACIGKITPTALIVMTVIQLACHSLNYVVLMGGVFSIADIGGTYIDHMFGAYFGLAVSYMLGMPAAEDKDHAGGAVPDVFSLIGTLFLWVYWPSFVAGADMANSVTQHRAIVHTILALAASTVSSFALSMSMSPNRKFRPVDIQNATLAGGVAIGVVANLTLCASDCILIGMAAGAVSTFGYNTIQPFLEQKEWVHDTCGVHNLHGMPAVVGAIASVILAASKGMRNPDHDTAIYGDETEKQWWLQLVGIVVCIAFAIVTGLATGKLLNLMGLMEKNQKFKDNSWWDLSQSVHGSSHGGSLQL